MLAPNDLYIYYIRGKAGNAAFSREFIGNWEEDGFSFLFFSKPADEAVENFLKSRDDLEFIDQFHMTYDEWHGGKLKPFSAGGFFICPAWYECENQGSELKIILDPGVVFGTGTHPTTCDCLDLLSCLCRKTQIESAIDLGTGTGLLAVAAGLLGCKYTLGVDFNFLAAQTAHRNIQLNGLSDRVLAVQGRAEDFIDYDADLVIANIHYDVMQHLILCRGFLQKKWFIISGLLSSQAVEVEKKLAKLPIKILEKRMRDGIWHTFFGKIQMEGTQ